MPRHCIPLDYNESFISEFCAGLSCAKYGSVGIWKAYQKDLKMLWESSFKYPSIWQALDSALDIMEGAEFIRSIVNKPDVANWIYDDAALEHLIHRGIKGRNGKLYHVTYASLISVIMVLESFAKGYGNISVTSQGETIRDTKAIWHPMVEGATERSVVP